MEQLEGTKGRVTKPHANIRPFNVAYWMSDSGWNRPKSFCSCRLKSNTVLILDIIINIVHYNLLSLISQTKAYYYTFQHRPPHTPAHPDYCSFQTIHTNSMLCQGHEMVILGGGCQRTPTQSLILQMKTLRSWSSWNEFLTVAKTQIYHFPDLFLLCHIIHSSSFFWFGLLKFHLLFKI